MIGNVRLEKAHEKIAHLTPTELAYIAGIVDGEGNIGIYELKSRPNGRAKEYIGLFPRLCIANTDARLFGWLLPRLPGSRLYTYVGSLGRKKPCGRFVYDGARAAALCRMMLPYLTIKKIKAQLVVEFYEGNLTCGRGISMPTEERERRVGILRRMAKELEIGRDFDRAKWPTHEKMLKEHYI